MGEQLSGEIFELDIFLMAVIIQILMDEMDGKSFFGHCVVVPFYFHLDEV